MDLDVSEDYILAAEFKEGGGGDYIQVNSDYVKPTPVTYWRCVYSLGGCADA